MKLLGLHHVSAITAAAAKNVDFYTQVMGLRLIKKTVNQDDVSVYHLFTEMSVELRVQKSLSLKFHMRDKLVQEITAFQLSLRVPNDKALDYWKNRFEQLDVKHGEITDQAGRLALSFEDFEGQRFFLVSDEHDHGMRGGTPWEKKPCPCRIRHCRTWAGSSDHSQSGEYYSHP